MSTEGAAHADCRSFEPLTTQMDRWRPARGNRGSNLTWSWPRRPCHGLGPLRAHTNQSNLYKKRDGITGWTGFWILSSFWRSASLGETMALDSPGDIIPMLLNPEAQSGIGVPHQYQYLARRPQGFVESLRSATWSRATMTIPGEIPAREMPGIRGPDRRHRKTNRCLLRLSRRT